MRISYAGQARIGICTNSFFLIFCSNVAGLVFVMLVCQWLKPDSLLGRADGADPPFLALF